MGNERERGTGRYKHTVERLCTCGHALAMHTAERVKHAGESLQPCIVADFYPSIECSCDCFRPAAKST